METSRRELLRSIGAAGAVATGAGAVGAQPANAQEQDLRKGAVITTVDEFEDNYTGQWVELNEETSAPGDPVEGCDAAEWSAGETQAYTGFLMDRRGGSSPIIELDVLTEAGDPGPEPDTTFIVNEARECENDFVFLDLRVVPIRSVAGEPAGPEVDDGGGDGGGSNSTPGFGVGVAAASLGAAAGIRAIRDRFG